MYGTVAKMRVKPGMLEQFKQNAAQYENLDIPGEVGITVYQMDADPNELYLAVRFASKEAYDANADSPEQAARFASMMALLESEPEWHDGEVVYSSK